jgi:hypothetical protein
VNRPCFIPKEVASVDAIGNLIMHNVSFDSQSLLPQVEQLLQQLSPKTEKQNKPAHDNP